MVVYMTSAVSVVLLMMIYKEQIQKTNKTKNVEGVSLPFNLIKNTITILTIVSLILSKALPVAYVAQVLSIILGSFTVFQYMKYKKSNK